jgi:hypothetical protein
MTKRKAKQTPMQQAIARLFEIEPNGSGSATAEQIAQVAEEFELWEGPAGLEGQYLEAVDRLADQ